MTEIDTYLLLRWTRFATSTRYLQHYKGRPNSKAGSESFLLHFHVIKAASMTYDSCRRLFSLFICLSISLLWLSQSASASLLAIDYGTEFIKASVIKPGVPFDVLLNRDSKRKIQSSVAWKGEDRLFGADAFNNVSKPVA